MYTILIVEDNKDYREDLAEMLELEGYAVLIAENGEAALSQIQQHPVNAIVSDDDMPVMTGIELLRAVKMDEQLQAIPFILLTGSSAYEGQLRDLGAEAICIKPVEIHELLLLLTRLLKP